ncbi:AAA family ATPase [soil metagenome]
MSSALWRARRRGERPVIYGRDRERARLRELLNDAIAGHGSLVLISGEAGIGKTTLVDDLIQEARERDCLVLAGGCYDLTTTPPYGPWVEALRSYRQNDGLPPLPAWFGNPKVLEQVGSQVALFEETRQFLTAVASHLPLVVVLEDLHWSDGASLEALRYLARQLSDDAILLVVTYRDDELTRRHELYQLLPLLVRESRPERIHLTRLDDLATIHLIQGRYELPAAEASQLAGYIQERSEGNPLFASELLGGLEDDGTLRRTERGWHVGALAERSVPPLLQQVIEGRLHRLDQDTREFLELAAVIGHDVLIDLWQQVSGRASVDLNAAIVSALEAKILEESADGASVAFRHALIREALYLGIAPLDRRDRHRQVADVLIGQPGADPDAVVTHLEHAFDARALEWLVTAGDRAMQSFAWEVAIERYERALELLERQGGPDPIQHCELLLALGEAQNRVAAGRLAAGVRFGLGAGGSYVGRDTFWSAAEVARRGGTPEQLARAALGVVGFNPAPQQAGIRGVQLLEEALERLPDDDSPLCVRILARLGVDPYFQATDWETLPFTRELVEQVLAKSDAAIAMARRLSDPASLAYALVMRCMQRELRPVDALLAAADEAVEVATIAGDRSILAWALLQKSSVLEICGDTVGQRGVMDQGARVAEELQLPFFLWGVAMREAAVALAEGRLADAEQHIDEGDRVQPQSGAGTVLRIALRLEQDRAGDLDQELEHLDNFIQSIPHMDPIRLLVQLQIGQTDDAQKEFEAITATAITSGSINQPRIGQLRWITRLSKICVGLGCVEHARACYDAMLPFAGRNVYFDSADIGGCVSYYLGLLATLMACWDEAEAHFAEALRMNKQWGYRLHVAHTQYAWGDMLLRHGLDDRGRAHEMLEQARTLANEIGPLRLLKLIDELSPRRPTEKPIYPAGLTSREVEVLRLVARGMTDAEAAEELFLSPRTISQHLRNAYNKLGVNNRAEATRVAVEQGIV